MFLTVICDFENSLARNFAQSKKLRKYLAQKYGHKFFYSSLKKDKKSSDFFLNVILIFSLFVVKHINWFFFFFWKIVSNFAIAQKNISCMNKKRKIAGKKGKKNPPSCFVSDFFYLTKAFFFFYEFSHVECVPEKFNWTENDNFRDIKMSKKKYFFFVVL